MINRIAAGGMAEVFLAQSVGVMGFRRLVALKLIHSNFTQDPDFLKMFIDEARIAMHLHHRNIVQVFDLDEVEGTYFIAMEYVRGINLYNLYEQVAAQKRWVEVPMALYIVAEVCKGLHFAHTRTSLDDQPLAIVHRDISPQNVLLSFEGEVKITDFGIATAAAKLHKTADGVVKGKYAYMAPERLGDGAFDARVDVFSAGVLLYELLVGESPFADKSSIETIQAVLTKEVVPPSQKGAEIPSGLDDICLKALAKNPEDRWPTALAFADALTELAMELTYARKDMASGDAALAKLLSQLNPNLKSSAVRPQSIQLPEVNSSSSEKQSSSQNPTSSAKHLASDLVSPEIYTPQTSLPSIVTQPDTPAIASPIYDDETAPNLVPATDNMDNRYSTNTISYPTVDDSTSANHNLPPVWEEGDTDESNLRASVPPTAHVKENAGHTSAARKKVSSWSASLNKNWISAVLLILGAILFSAVGWVVWSGRDTTHVKAPLRLITEPPGAKIFINQYPLAQITPALISVPLDEHTPVEVTFRLVGYNRFTQQLSVEERRKGIFRIQLQPKKPTQSKKQTQVRVVTLRPKRGQWSHVYFDGKDQGPSPITLELPIGVVEIEVIRSNSSSRRELKIKVPESGPASIL